MARKRVALIVKHSPMNSALAAEALRQGVGLTLVNNELVVLLLDAGAWLSVPLSPGVLAAEPIRKPIDTLFELEAHIKVERESMERFGIPQKEVIPNIEVISQAEVIAEMTIAEATIIF